MSENQRFVEHFVEMQGMNTFAIVTQDASPLLGAIHNDGKQQPLILKGDAALSWMIPGLNENEIMVTYFQYPDDKLQTFRVADGVYSNNVDTNFPEIILPYSSSSRKIAA
jgi:putative SOS response-associated peptidase YedK